MKWRSICSVFSILIGCSRSHFHEPNDLGSGATNFFNLQPQPQPPQQPPPQFFQPQQTFFQPQTPPPFIPTPPPFVQPSQAPRQIVTQPPQVFTFPTMPPQVFTLPTMPPQVFTLPTIPPQVFTPPPPIQQVTQPPVSQPPTIATSPANLFQCQPGEIRIATGAVTFRFNNKAYWFSWSDRANAQKNWVEAEKACRKLCMELVSLDAPGETEFIATMIPQFDIHGLWTGGRLCNFPGCEKDPRFQPISVNGWVWATKGLKIGSDPGGRWSATGGLGKPQPDNLLGSQGGENEECIGLLSNWYGDGTNFFHDLACSEPLPFVCEQS